MQPTGNGHQQEVTTRPIGFAAMLAVLFVVSQVLCCLHTHDPFEEVGHVIVAHDDGTDDAGHQTACDVCLIAGMPVDSATGADGDTLLPVRGLASRQNHGQTWLAIRQSPNHARAPPLI